MAYGQSANGIRAILYDDANLFIDVSGTTQGIPRDATISVAASDQRVDPKGAYSYTTYKASECQLQDGKCLFDYTGTNGVNGYCMPGNAKITVTYGTEPITDTIEMTIPELTEEMTFVVYDGSTSSNTAFGNRTKVHTLSQAYTGDGGWTDYGVNAGKGESVALNTETSWLSSSSLTDPDGRFELIGWTLEADGTSLFLDLNEHTIEDIIYDYADQSIGVGTSGKMNSMTLYGCYKEKSLIKDTAYPVAYGQGGNGVRAILYDDGQLMVDFGKVSSSALLGKSDLCGFTITNSASGSVVLENQAMNQGKLYVDLIGKDNLDNGFMCAEGTLTIAIGSNDSDPFEDSVVLDVPKDLAAMTFVIYDGSTTDTDGNIFKDQAKVNTLAQDYTVTADPITGDAVVVKRGASMALGPETDGLAVDNLTDPYGIFELIGWTVKGTDGSLALDLNEHTIEDIIYAYADGTFTGAGKTNSMTFYGCYGEKTYKIRLYDSDGSGTPLGKKFILTSETATATVTGSVESYVNQEVDANGYAILRIQQPAGAHASYVYTFKHQALTAEGAADTKEDGTEDQKAGKTVLDLGENEGYCTIQYLASGVYKISSVKKDLNIEIAATPNTDAPLSYNLSVDYVKNSTVGTARVSLDLYDANVADSGDTLRIDGTYYRNVGNIRTYGQLSTINSSITTVEAYVDLQQDNAVIGGEVRDKDDSSSEVDANGYKAPGNFAQGHMELESADASSYDLVITLPTINDTNVFFYAAQAVWSAGGTDIETPWAIAENVSE